jgi:predicted 3-demethylubiquinone-9 3-methyltransferase (glyoxalase superfamily)
MVTFTLLNINFMAISAGPYFKLNPSASLFFTFNNEAEIDDVWNKLVEGGSVLMPYHAYPWAQKYGWLTDRFGVSWQLSMSEHHITKQRITPMLMFTQSVAGKAKEAIEKYTALFPNSKTEMLVPYAEGEGGTVGFLKHARFTLDGLTFMAMDSSAPHAFTFNEAMSFLVTCDTQEEIDRYWDALIADGGSESQCGWCKDKYGVSWQIVPRIMNQMMTSGDSEKINRVTQAFLKMKKFDIATLQKAFDGE